MKKTPTIIVLFLLIAMVFSPLLASADTNTSRTIYVDDDNTSWPWDGSSEHPYRTIQDGVEAAGAGDTVYVLEGHYGGKASLKSSITVQGENAETTILDAFGTNDAFEIWEEEEISLSGFTMRNSRRGVYIFGSNQIEIFNNIFFNNSEAAIELYASAHVSAFNNSINNSHRGISLCMSTNNIFKYNSIGYVTIGIWYSQSSNFNRIIGNRLENSSYGLSSSYFFPENTKNNESSELAPPMYSHFNIVGRNIFSNNECGLHFGGWTSLNLVSHNEFRQSSRYGVYCQPSSSIFTNNNFIENDDDVHFEIVNIGLFFNPFIHNYWDDWRLPLPKPIVGVYHLFSVSEQEILFSCPWVKFDLMPALTPCTI